LLLVVIGQLISAGFGWDLVFLFLLDMVSGGVSEWLHHDLVLVCPIGCTIEEVVGWMLRE